MVFSIFKTKQQKEQERQQEGYEVFKGAIKRRKNKYFTGLSIEYGFNKIIEECAEGGSLYRLREYWNLYNKVNLDQVKADLHIDYGKNKIQQFTRKLDNFDTGDIGLAERSYYLITIIKEMEFILAHKEYFTVTTGAYCESKKTEVLNKLKKLFLTKVSYMESSIEAKNYDIEYNILEKEVEYINNFLKDLPAQQRNNIVKAVELYNISKHLQCSVVAAQPYKKNKRHTQKTQHFNRRYYFFTADNFGIYYIIGFSLR